MRETPLLDRAGLKHTHPHKGTQEYMAESLPAEDPELRVACGKVRLETWDSHLLRARVEVLSLIAAEFGQIRGLMGRREVGRSKKG
jgi:hypothetical protein